MNVPSPRPARQGRALAATLCIALLAVLSGALLSVEDGTAIAWAGLDDVHAGQAASCAGVGDAADRCGEMVCRHDADTPLA